MNELLEKERQSHFSGGSLQAKRGATVVAEAGHYERNFTQPLATLRFICSDSREFCALPKV